MGGYFENRNNNFMDNVVCLKNKVLVFYNLWRLLEKY